MAKQGKFSAILIWKKQATRKFAETCRFYLIPEIPDQDQLYETGKNKRWDFCLIFHLFCLYIELYKINI